MRQNDFKFMVPILIRSRWIINRNFFFKTFHQLLRFVFVMSVWIQFHHWRLQKPWSLRQRKILITGLLFLWVEFVGRRRRKRSYPYIIYLIAMKILLKKFVGSVGYPYWMPCSTSVSREKKGWNKKNEIGEKRRSGNGGKINQARNN